MEKGRQILILIISAEKDYTLEGSVMIIQGYGKITPLEAKSRYSQSKIDKRAFKTDLFSTNDIVELKSDPAERAELLQKIKNKVKTGYYNSESVLEDLSHGFAKALDQSV